MAAGPGRKPVIRAPLQATSFTAVKCLLIVDPPRDGPTNMAIDEALLEDAANSNRATLRLYQWNPATLSLGYFQRYADRDRHAASQGCPVVRRQSGGGAILHDRELTYSLSLPVQVQAKSADADLVCRVHQTLVKTLSELGVDTSTCVVAETRDHAFLCFQRRSIGDICMDDAKVAGSAQRRRHGALLQHGSILLEKSPHAPELPGILELSGTPVAAAQLTELWLPHFRNEFGAELIQGELPTEIAHRAAELKSCKYQQAAWNQKR